MLMAAREQRDWEQARELGGQKEDIVIFASKGHQRTQSSSPPLFIGKV